MCFCCLLQNKIVWALKLEFYDSLPLQYHVCLSSVSCAYLLIKGQNPTHSYLSFSGQTCMPFSLGLNLWVAVLKFEKSVLDIALFAWLTIFQACHDHLLSGCYWWALLQLLWNCTEQMHSGSHWFRSIKNDLNHLFESFKKEAKNWSWKLYGALEPWKCLLWGNHFSIYWLQNNGEHSNIQALVITSLIINLPWAVFYRQSLSCEVIDKSQGEKW